MKKKFILVAIGSLAITVVPLASAGASTTKAQKLYLTAVHKRAPSTRAIPNKKMVLSGKAFCSILGLHYSVANEVALLKEPSNTFHFPEQQVMAIVATQVTYLCPSHTKAVKAFEAKQNAKPSSPKVTVPPVTAPPVTAPPVTAPPVTVPPAPTMTQQQQSAVEEANQYLNTEAFSQQGLIDQLDSPDGGGYTVNDATVAVDSLTENWSAEAVQSASEYLQTEPFSCSDLIQQLDSPDGGEFTVAQATYGATQAGDC
jgi:hypothetical protein